MSVALPVFIGLLFGFALQKAGLGHYDKIVNQFRFKDNSMMKFMLSAIAVGSACFFLFRDLGLAAATPLHNTYFPGNLAGGLIFGAGMALAGTCPGTVIAGIGQGNLDYLVAGFLGFLAGAFIFGAGFGFFLPLMLTAFHGEISWRDIAGVSHWLFVAAFIAACAILYCITGKGARHAE
jgi:uncharacterized membrane protein YedE/YeeE